MFDGLASLSLNDMMGTAVAGAICALTGFWLLRRNPGPVTASILDRSWVYITAIFLLVMSIMPIVLIWLKGYGWIWNLDPPVKAMLLTAYIGEVVQATAFVISFSGTFLVLRRLIVRPV